MEKLPGRMGDLLTLACADGRALLAEEKKRRKAGERPVYHFLYDRWHSPEHDYCTVCLSGAVIARRLGARPADEAFPTDFTTEYPALSALDAMRRLRWHSAAESLGAILPDEVFERLPRPDDHPERWFRSGADFAQLLDVLEPAARILRTAGI